MPSSDSPIIAFYEGTGTDHRGRTLQQIWDLSLDDLEVIHDYIQWLFPLPEPSSANSHAPILTDDDISRFHRSPELREELRRSLLTMLEFYGLELSGPQDLPAIAQGPGFRHRGSVWLHHFNHNFLRLTRILRSLTVLGRGDDARALLVCLEDVHAGHARVIGSRTLAFWRGAVRP